MASAQSVFDTIVSDAVADAQRRAILCPMLTSYASDRGVRFARRRIGEIRLCTF